MCCNGYPIPPVHHIDYLKDYAMYLIHISDLRNAFDSAVAQSYPALYGWNSGAFDLDLKDLLDAMAIFPITLDDLDDLDNLDRAQIDNGEWFKLDEVLEESEGAFDSFVDHPSGIIFPQRVADIEQIYADNTAAVEHAFSESVDLSEVNSIYDVISLSVTYAVRDAYRIDMAELFRNFVRELEFADTVTV